MKRFQGWDTVSNILASLISMVCMASMAAFFAAAGAADAGLSGMAGMATGAATTGGPSKFLRLARFFEFIGLKSLTQVPNALAQPVLIVALLISVGASYIAYRRHNKLAVPVLTLISAVIMYGSIYIWMSEALYFISLMGLLAIAVWTFLLARRYGGILVKET